MSVTSVYQLVSDSIASLAGSPVNAQPVPVSGFASSSGTVYVNPLQGPVQRWLVSGTASSVYVVAASTPPMQQIYDFYGADNTTHTINFGFNSTSVPYASGYRCTTQAGLSVTPNTHSVITFIGIDGNTYQEMARATGIPGP